jgi:hypothetical protein
MHCQGNISVGQSAVETRQSQQLPASRQDSFSWQQIRHEVPGCTGKGGGMWRSYAGQRPLVHGQLLGGAACIGTEQVARLSMGHACCKACSQYATRACTVQPSCPPMSNPAAGASFAPAVSCQGGRVATSGVIQAWLPSCSLPRVATAPVVHSSGRQCQHRQWVGPN